MFDSIRGEADLVDGEFRHGAPSAEQVIRAFDVIILLKITERPRGN